MAQKTQAHLVFDPEIAAWQSATDTPERFLLKGGA
jgi:hypothetical protein